MTPTVTAQAVRVPLGATRPPERVADDRRITVRQAADLMGVTTETIYRHCKTGRLPHDRVGRAIRIRVTDLQAYDGRAQQDASARAGRRAAASTPPPAPRAPRGRFTRLAREVGPAGEDA